MQEHAERLQSRGRLRVFISTSVIHVLASRGTLNNQCSDKEQSLSSIRAQCRAFMHAFHQAYTNTEACLYAGTFIQHDHLNILRQYLHRPYLQGESTADYITACGLGVFCIHVSTKGHVSRDVGSAQVQLTVQLEATEQLQWTLGFVETQAPSHKKLRWKHKRTYAPLFLECLGTEVSHVKFLRFSRRGHRERAKFRQLPTESWRSEGVMVSSSLPQSSGCRSTGPPLDQEMVSVNHIQVGIHQEIIQWCQPSSFGHNEVKNSDTCKAF